METAMQELIKWWDETPLNEIRLQFPSKATELLAKEKEQIENSFVSGCTNSSFDIEYGALARKYYTQTFNTAAANAFKE